MVGAGDWQALSPYLSLAKEVLRNLSSTPMLLDPGQ